MRSLVVAGVICFTLGHSAYAYDDKGAYGVYGAGAISCGKWTEDRRANNPQSFASISWVMGFRYSRELEHTRR